MVGAVGTLAGLLAALALIFGAVHLVRPRDREFFTWRPSGKRLLIVTAATCAVVGLSTTWTGLTTANVGQQWLARCGETDNAVVTVTTLWADERLSCPLHAVPYTPPRHFPQGRRDPASRTK
ncbi:hypothetical protein ACIP4X_20730 [Streptomyces sp. NPDC088817]|uniref:hypothetical protein n=1 Tax=unclassified Streptomyces TaxID=2593676 RepID=UPI0036E2794D